MATKLTRNTKTGRHRLDSKRVTFDRGKAKTNGGSTPIKTTEKEHTS